MSTSNKYKYEILLANIISGFSIIPYLPPAIFLYGMAHDSPSHTVINTSLPGLVIISIYPALVILSIRFSWKYYRNDKNSLACFIAYSPLLIVLIFILILIVANNKMK